MSHCHNSGQNLNTSIVNELCENVGKFKYLGMTLSNQNDVHDEIKRRLRQNSWVSLEWMFM